MWYRAQSAERASFQTWQQENKFHESAPFLPAFPIDMFTHVYVFIGIVTTLTWRGLLSKIIKLDLIWFFAFRKDFVWWVSSKKRISALFVSPTRHFFHIKWTEIPWLANMRHIWTNLNINLKTKTFKTRDITDLSLFWSPLESISEK